PGRFQVTALAARSKSSELLNLAKRFGAKYACLAEPSAETTKLYRAEGIELAAGTAGLESMAELPGIDHVVFASSGTDAVTALQKALTADKDVSLANKESIVATGPWIMPLIRRPDQLRPLDSEHSAIWQCLRGEPEKSPSRITLTASGGPFRDYSTEQMRHITPEDALRHPVWNMGPKITVDSANLMNKGIECIEAMQLFDMPPDRVGAVVHPGSFVHGIVEFCDATMKMLSYKPDMRIPAACALGWPERLPIGGEGEFAAPERDRWSLEFQTPDTARFPCLALALEAAKRGYAYPPLLVGADESAVRAFLDKRIPFLAISNIIESILEKYSGQNPSNINDAVELIALGERLAEDACKEISGR
ncbi:MAG: 1-deoxy-D-xylulose-5-phosphate reductoisomerase, partial [Synergistaceae bacterium]|nr:1-deoxy-D-xylulose-5-phosphate reductoisomerase [Synergistaceae bacterium]